MSVDGLLGELRAAGIRVMLDGETVRVDAPIGALTPTIRERLKARKPEIVAFLRLAEQLQSQQRAIVPLQQSGSRAPMFGVAGHNGDVFAYRALARHLGEDQPFYGLQPPGYDEGTVPVARVEELAAYFAAQIAAFHAAGSCTITGFCAGGTVAFELARQLADKGIVVQRLVLFGSPFCKWYRPGPQAIAGAMRAVARARHHMREMARLHVRRWPTYVADMVRRRRARPPEAAPDLLHLRRRGVEEATMQAVRAYTPGRFAGHVDLMLPAESWRHLAYSMPRWGDYAASSALFCGPDDCTSDTMLLEEHAPVFAALVARSAR